MQNEARRPVPHHCLRHGALCAWLLAGVAGAILAGCARQHAQPEVRPADARALIDRLLPHALADRMGWTDDIYTSFAVLAVAPGRENICAVAAVVDQESGFRVDPVIPGLPAIAWREIDVRAAQAGVPRAIVHGVLQLRSPTGRTYAERIDTARTEKSLSDVYQDLIGTVPLGRTLFAAHDPIRTRGPMQVQVTFAEQFAAAKSYPYPIATRIADEVFTRRGGLYFGIAHLLAYPAPYDRYLYRFADFNAGQYASRNAAFQVALSSASGLALVPDGALLPHGVDNTTTGATESAARTLAARLDLSESAIRRALERGKSEDFAQTPLYQRTFALAENAARHALPRALVPRIELHGPKLTRKLTTEWYANRVNGRFERCLRQPGAVPL